MSVGFESYLERLAALFARTQKVRVVVRGDRGPYTDLETLTIHLPATAEYLAPENRPVFEGFLDHEVGHVRAEVSFPDEQRFTVIGASLDALERHLLNVVEDVRTELEGAGLWPGVAINLEAAFRYVLREAEQRGGHDPLYLIATAFIGRARGFDDTVEWMPASVHEIVDRLADLIDRARSATCPRDSRDIAVEFAARLRALGVDKPEAGEPAPSQGGTGSGDGEAPGAEPSPGAMRLARSAVEQDAEQAETPMHGAKESIEREAKAAALADPGRYLPHPLAVADDFWGPPPDDMIEADAFEEARVAGGALVGGIATRLVAFVRAAMPVETFDLESGDLDTAALARLRLGDGRVFRDETPAPRTATAVTLLVDRSGSMAVEDKIGVARAAVWAAAEALERLRIPSEIVAFDTVYDRGVEIIGGECSAADHGLYTRFEPLRMLQIKGFDERWVAVRPRIGALVAGENNDDAAALLAAARRLLARPEPRRLLVVLSDGMPHHLGGFGKANPESMLAEHLRDAVKRCRRAGVRVGALGMLSPHVSKFFPAWECVDRVEQIPSKLLALLRRMIVGR